ncbi:MAG: ROK family protein, partial [Bryobacterales bacterium]|nr:ROK family protein [Bryobacterales bacterium]
EEYAAERALLRSYHERTEGNPISIKDLVQRARQRDAVAVEVIEEGARSLALGISNLIIGLNPEAIVVDSWAADAWDMVEKSLWTVLRERVPAAWLEGIRIYSSAHSRDSSLLGAIALALTRYFHSFDHGESEESLMVHMR